MKTTIEISDSLLARIKALAARRKATLRAMVEEGLRLLLRQSATRHPYRFEDTTFDGEGLQPGIREGDWETIRDRIYEGRGS